MAHTKAPWDERYALWKDCSRRQKRVLAALIPLHSALHPFSKSKNVDCARAKRFRIFNRSAKRFSNRACAKKIFLGCIPPPPPHCTPPPPPAPQSCLCVVHTQSFILCVFCAGSQNGAKCFVFHEQKAEMLLQKKSGKMLRDGREKCWPQKGDAKNQKKITYTICRVYQLTYMPYLPARPYAAISAHRKEIFRAENLLASHISRSAFSRPATPRQISSEMAGPAGSADFDTIFIFCNFWRKLKIPPQKS